MSATSVATDAKPVILHLGSVLQKVSNHEFFEICQRNRDWRIERTAEGDLIIMPPTGGRTGVRNLTLTGLFFAWVEADGTGVGFDSSTGFALPNGAKRSPDLACWNQLTPEEQEEFPPLCSAFVIELRSQYDALESLQKKMQEYLENEASLGWLIDPLEKKVYIYRPHAAVVCLENPQTISGEPELPGFTLDLQRIWL
jgi:Uma2 family endonuclease